VFAEITGSSLQINAFRGIGINKNL